MIFGYALVGIGMVWLGRQVVVAKAMRKSGERPKYSFLEVLAMVLSAIVVLAITCVMLGIGA